MEKPRVRESEYFWAWLPFMFCALAVAKYGGLFPDALIKSVMKDMAFDPKTIYQAQYVSAFVTGLAAHYVFFRVFVGKFLARKLEEAREDEGRNEERAAEVDVVGVR